MNDEAVCRTAPATPGLLKIAWEGDTQTHTRTDIATTRPNRPSGPIWWKCWSLETIPWLDALATCDRWLDTWHMTHDLFKKKYIFILSCRCYHPHMLRDSVFPVCKIFRFFAWILDFFVSLILSAHLKRVSGLLYMWNFWFSIFVPLF